MEHAPGRYALAILDFDGTLADTWPAFVDALESVVARHGLRAIGREELERYRAGHGRALMQRLGVRWWRLAKVSAAMLQAMTERRAQMRLFPGVAQALSELAAGGVVLAVVSSNSEDNVRAVLGEAGALVGVYECGAAVFGKAAKFRRVLARTRMVADATIAIGDELRDQDAAKKAGIAFGAVAWGYTEARTLREAGPVLMFDTPGDLVCLLP